MYIHALVSSTCLNQEFKCSNDDLFDPFAFGNPCGHFSTIVCRVRLVGPACGLLREGICSICYCWCSSMASGFIEWRAHPANSTPNLLYNRWHFHTAGCFANCVWSHYNCLMCVFACIWKLIYIKWYIYIWYIYICVIIYIHVYLDTWTSSCATPIPRSILVSNHPRSCLQRFPWMFQWKMPVPRTALAKKVVLLVWLLSRYVFFGHILDFPYSLSSFEFSGILYVTH